MNFCMRKIPVQDSKEFLQVERDFTSLKQVSTNVKWGFVNIKIVFYKFKRSFTSVETVFSIKNSNTALSCKKTCQLWVTVLQVYKFSSL